MSAAKSYNHNTPNEMKYCVSCGRSTLQMQEWTLTSGDRICNFCKDEWQRRRENLSSANETEREADFSATLLRVLTQRAQQIDVGETPRQRLAQYHGDLAKKLRLAAEVLFRESDSEEAKDENIADRGAREIFIDIAAFALQAAEHADQKDSY